MDPLSLPFELSFLQSVLRNDFFLSHTELQSHMYRWGHDDTVRYDRKLAQLTYGVSSIQRLKTTLSKAEIHLILQSHSSKEFLLLHK